MVRTDGQPRYGTEPVGLTRRRAVQASLAVGGVGLAWLLAGCEVPGTGITYETRRGSSQDWLQLLHGGLYLDQFGVPQVLQSVRGLSNRGTFTFPIYEDYTNPNTGRNFRNSQLIKATAFTGTATRRFFLNPDIDGDQSVPRDDATKGVTQILPVTLFVLGDQLGDQAYRNHVTVRGYEVHDSSKGGVPLRAFSGGRPVGVHYLAVPTRPDAAIGSNANLTGAPNTKNDVIALVTGIVPATNSFPTQ